MSFLLIDETQMQRHFEAAAIRIQAIGASILDSFEKTKVEMESGEFMRMGTDAVIQIIGPTQYKYDFWCWLFDGCAYQCIQAQFLNALNDDSAKRIVLYVDCPGGQATGCKELADLIFASRGAKEIIAVIDPLAASAGYWLASQADRIVAIESAFTGCIGSQMILKSYYKMFQEAGIDIAVLRSKGAEDKNISNPYEPMSDRAKELYQTMLDGIGEKFYAGVARGRGVSVDVVKKDFGNGQVFYTPEAIERGMVDQMGTLQQVLLESKPKQTQSKRMNARAEFLRF